VQCLNWLVIKPAPRDFIESYIGGSDYWANGIRKEFRTTNPDQVAFCDTFKKILTGLMDYVKEYHTTGVSWNPKGGDITEYSADTAAAAPAAAAKAVAPAAAAAAAAAPAPAAPAADVKAGLFAALAKGGSVTAGLKTVTKGEWVLFLRSLRRRPSNKLHFLSDKLHLLSPLCISVCRSADLAC
jgi:adenylyl cyclase-associated protein